MLTTNTNKTSNRCRLFLEHPDCEGQLVLYHRSKSNPSSDLTSTALTGNFYSQRSLRRFRSMELVRLEVTEAEGQKCCWHVRFYDRDTGEEHHYEHLEHGDSVYNKTIVDWWYTEQWYLSAEKDPCEYVKYRSHEMLTSQPYPNI